MILWSELGKLKRYVEQSEQWLAGELRELEERVNESVKGLETQEANEYCEMMSDEYWLLSDVLRQLTYRAHVLIAYSLFEHRLHDLCKLTHGLGLTKKAPRKKNFYANDAEGFLRREVKLPKRALGRSWSKLHVVKHIRNAVAHTDARLQRDSKYRRTRLFIAKERTLSIDQHTRIIFTIGFCRWLLRTIGDTLKCLIRGVDEKTKLKKNKHLQTKLAV